MAPKKNSLDFGDKIDEKVAFKKAAAYSPTEEVYVNEKLSNFLTVKVFLNYGKFMLNNTISGEVPAAQNSEKSFHITNIIRNIQLYGTSQHEIYCTLGCEIKLVLYQCCTERKRYYFIIKNSPLKK